MPRERLEGGSGRRVRTRAIQEKGLREKSASGETGESHVPKLRTTVRKVVLCHDTKSNSDERTTGYDKQPRRSQGGSIRRRQLTRAVLGGTVGGARKSPKMTEVKRRTGFVTVHGRDEAGGEVGE